MTLTWSAKIAEANQSHIILGKCRERVTISLKKKKKKKKKIINKKNPPTTQCNCNVKKKNDNIQGKPGMHALHITHGARPPSYTAIFFSASPEEGSLQVTDKQAFEKKKKKKKKKKKNVLKAIRHDTKTPMKSGTQENPDEIREGGRFEKNSFCPAFSQWDPAQKNPSMHFGMGTREPQR